MVSSGGHAPFCWIWYIHSLSLQGQIGTGLDLFPKGFALFLLEEEGMFQSQPGFSSLPALSSRMSTSAASLSSGSCSASHRVSAEMALALQVLCFDCSSTEMSMASQSLTARKMFEKLKEINFTRLGENIFG